MSEIIIFRVKEGEHIVLNVKEGEPCTVVDDGVNITVYPGQTYSCQYGPVAPVLIKRSDLVLLYTLNSGDTQIITDSNIQSHAGGYNVNVKSQANLVLPKTHLINSDLSKDIEIESCVDYNLPDITVTNPITGATYTKPGLKDLTESLSKQGKLTFPPTYADTLDYDITTVEAATYATETLDNVATVVYTVNSVVKTLPFTVANGETLNVTITRTNTALKSSVILTT